MNLPDKKYEPKHNRELKDYAQGWNYCLKEIERLCDEYDDEYAKESLLRRKEVALKKGKTPFYEGVYDCIIEIEKLNKEQERLKDPENMCDPPLEPQQAIYFLCDYLLGGDWYVAMPESQKQVNSAIVHSILLKYSKKYKKELKTKQKKIYTMWN